MTRTFRAPWNRELRFMTTAGCVVCFGVALISLVSLSGLSPVARISVLIIPLLLLAGGALFMVRGYTVDNHEMLVRRLGWSSRIDLRPLVSAIHDPSATAGSVRIAANGGLFGFCGWFSNQTLGRYRAFATDPSLSVILRFTDRVIVVTPDTPEKFVEAIKGEGKLTNDSA